MSEILKKIEYDLYIVLLGGLSFLSYIGLFSNVPFPIYLLISVGIGLYFIIKGSSIMYILPIFMFLQMGFADLRNDVRITTIYSLVFTALIIVDVIKNRKLKKLGRLFIPQAVLLGISVVTFINAPDTFTWFAGLTQVLSILILYIYFVNTIEDEADNFIKVSKIFMYSAMLVTFEMCHYLAVSDLDIITVIRTRTINLGWENLNIIIYSNILSIPLIAYLVVKSKIKLPYMIFSGISILGVLLTLSRSSILTLGVMILCLIPWVLIKETNRKSLIIQASGFLVILLFTGLLIEQQEIVTDYFDSLLGRDLMQFDDRRALLIVAWEQFKMNPLFGSGGLYSSRVHLAHLGPLNYHNTLAQASTLGITGLLAFGYLWVEKTRMIYRKKNDFRWPLIVLIFTTSFVNGSLQPMYFYTTYMIFVFMMLAMYENTSKTA